MSSPFGVIASTMCSKRTNLRLEADSAWDIATLAVDPEYRGRATDGLVSLGLLPGRGSARAAM